MGLTVVLGGQYGGEGKGSIIAFLAQTGHYGALVKTGGPNSAHSFGAQGKLKRVRMVPSGASLCGSPIVFPAGSLIHVDTLLYEMSSLGLRNEVLVNPQAGIVSNEHAGEQAADSFYDRVGSTLTGTGAASAMRARRRLRLASEEPRLASFIRDTTVFLSDLIEAGGRVLVEGAQGYGLSNYHGDYPYVSSRDCTVGSALAQVGLGPHYLDQTILVAKCFPTRNRHGQGHLPRELALGDDARLSAALTESGGGSFSGGDAPRRVALFDVGILRQALVANTPTGLALTGLDRLEALQSVERIKRHYGTPDDFVRATEEALGLPILFEGWGPFVECVRDRRPIAFKAR